MVVDWQNVEQWFSLSKEIFDAEQSGNLDTVSQLKKERDIYRQSAEEIIRASVEYEAESMLGLHVNADFKFDNLKTAAVVSKKGVIEVTDYIDYPLYLTEPEKLKIEEKYNNRGLAIYHFEGSGFRPFDASKPILLNENKYSHVKSIKTLGHETFHNAQLETKNWKALKANNFEAKTIGEISANIFGRELSRKYFETNYGKNSAEMAELEDATHTNNIFFDEAKNLANHYAELAKTDVTKAEEYLKENISSIPIHSRVVPNAAFLAICNMYGNDEKVTEKLEAIYSSVGPAQFSIEVGNMESYADLDKTFSQYCE